MFVSTTACLSLLLAEFPRCRSFFLCLSFAGERCCDTAFHHHLLPFTACHRVTAVAIAGWAPGSVPPGAGRPRLRRRRRPAAGRPGAGGGCGPDGAGCASLDRCVRRDAVRTDLTAHAAVVPVLLALLVLLLDLVLVRCPWTRFSKLVLNFGVFPKSICPNCLVLRVLRVILVHNLSCASSFCVRVSQLAHPLVFSNQVDVQSSRRNVLQHCSILPGRQPTPGREGRTEQQVREKTSDLPLVSLNFQLLSS